MVRYFNINFFYALLVRIFFCCGMLCRIRLEMNVKMIFEKMPGPKAFFFNAGPAIISMLVTLIYNVADIFL